MKASTALGTNQPSNPAVLDWVNSLAALTTPDSIFWCDGSEAEDQLMRQRIVDSGAGLWRREFSRGMEARRGEEDVEFRQTLKRGWRLGGEDFLDRLQERMAENSTENHDPRQVGEAMAVRASKMIEEELRRVKLRREDLGRMRKGDPVKVRLAERLHRETPMTLRWIAEALQMGSWRYVSFLLYQRRRKI